MALTQVKTNAIADDAVTTDKLANAINTERTANTAKVSLEDNAVTLAKMAGGTDGQIITYDASGDPVAVGPGTDGQVLTSTGAGSPPAFEDLPTSGPTLTGSTNNTVCTVTGANAIAGEANLTFDGTKLVVKDSDNSGNQLWIVGRANGNSSSLSFRNNADDAYVSRLETDSTSGLKFEVGGSERLRIGANGTVMVGGTLQAGANGGLNAESTSSGSITAPLCLINQGTADGSGVVISHRGKDDAGNQEDYNYIRMVAGDTGSGSEDGYITFWTANGGSLGERVRIQPAGGISFNGDSAAANALNDYEEGTWSPGMHRSSSGTSSMAYNYQYGRYTKIGDFVYVQFDLDVSSWSGGGGSFRVSGLPFPPSVSSAGAGYGAPQFRASSFLGSDFNTSQHSSWITDTAGGAIYPMYFNSSGGDVYVSSPESSGRVTGYATYFTNS